MRLSDRLLLQRRDDGVFCLIDRQRSRDAEVALGLEDLARIALGTLYFAALVPDLKEELIAALIDMDPERRAFLHRTVMDAAEDLSRVRVADGEAS